MRPAAIGLGLVAALAAGCTSGEGERARPGPEPTERATTTFETLPPVGSYLYPTDPDVVIAQITVAGTGLQIPLPLLTIYGDGRTISVDGDRWLQGTLNEIELQEFFRDADGVGLLDEPLDLRGPGDGETPDIDVVLAVNGIELQHSLDLSEIERPVALRSFLVQASSFNVFGLREPFEPEEWVSCDGEICFTYPVSVADGDRPVLPHEDRSTVLQEAAAGLT